MKTAGITLVFILAAIVAPAQSPAPQATLRVTVVVKSSVALVPAADGSQQLVVANAPDPKETFSATGPLGGEARGVVHYTPPAGPVPFDVIREIRSMKTTGDKAVPRPSAVVTAVPR
jgi:hypothetical protein